MIRHSFNSKKRQLINSAKRSLSAVLPYQPMDGSRETLDAEYSAGKWEYLKGLEEAPRFNIVAGYCHYLRKDGSILDVGCGEGILQERLDASKYSRYVGVDVSEEAISRACRKRCGNVYFINADAASFVPGECFDLIVFNECLEYFTEPAKLVQRYELFLKIDGLFIVSMFVGLDTTRTKRIWRTLGSIYKQVAETRVSNPSGYAWIIQVLTPRKGER